MTRAERAKGYFLGGYNCAQAVGLAFSDLLHTDEETLTAALLPLGGGLARLRETCGAVSGGAVALGLLHRGESKADVYALVRSFAEKFSAETGSINCGTLLSGAGVDASKGGNPEARTAAYYRKRPCAELVFLAAQIIEEGLTSSSGGEISEPRD